MHEPDYTDYSLTELQDCLNHVNRDKFPERYRQLQQEVSLRREQGETVTDPVLNELLAEDVPATLALQALWYFLLRFAAAALVCGLLLQGLIRINSLLDIFPPVLLNGVLLVAGIIFMTIAGTIIMSQVLAKRYRSYRIRIVRTGTSKDEQKR